MIRITRISHARAMAGAHPMKKPAPLPALLLAPPSQILRDEMSARRLSVVEMARRAHVHPVWIERLMRGGRIRTADAVMLSQALGTSADMWIALQAQWDAAHKAQRRRRRSTRAARWWLRARHWAMRALGARRRGV